MASLMKVARPVIKRIIPRAEREGHGDAKVKRSIGGHELNQFDPFLVLDEVISDTGTGGFPDHPHRGFETVTYMLEGGVQHEDFEGHKGIIGAGDLQWMTAGRGIIHSEILAGLGKTRGLQLWVNLSSQYKMIEPNYQELLSKDIAEVEKDGIKVRVIAGEAFGIKSEIYTRTPTMYLDFTLQQGSHLEQPIPASWNAFVYVLEGEGVFGDSTTSPAKSSQLLLLGSNGDGVEAWNNSETPLRFVLVGGQPLGEPVAAHGPFVMNTRAELEQTFKNYRSFTNGFEKARGWRSDAARRLNM